MIDRIREHGVTLRTESLTLRPMTENDWGLLLRWNQDPEVLYYADGDDNLSHDLATVQDIYRGVSQTAYNFVMEFGGRPIGDCWLQRMNLTRLLSRYPGEDLRRIDLLIGEKELWGRGLGTEAIGLLNGFGFEQERADRIFACGVADYNPRSAGAFRKCGYQVVGVTPEKPGGKMRFSYDLALTRERFQGQRAPRRRVLNMAEAGAITESRTPLPPGVEVVNAAADEQTLRNVLPDFDIYFASERVPLTAETLQRTRRLRLVVAPFRRLDHLDLQEMRRLGIRLLAFGADADGADTGEGATVAETGEMMMALIERLWRCLEANE